SLACLLSRSIEVFLRCIYAILCDPMLIGEVREETLQEVVLGSGIQRADLDCVECVFKNAEGAVIEAAKGAGGNEHAFQKAARGDGTCFADRWRRIRKAERRAGCFRCAVIWRLRCAGSTG